MFSPTMRSFGTTVFVAFCTCAANVTSADENVGHDALIAQLRRHIERREDSRAIAFAKDRLAEFVRDGEGLEDVRAAVHARERLAKLIRDGDTAATNACTTILDELRTRPESVWKELPNHGVATVIFESHLLEAFSEGPGFLAYVERAFDDPKTTVRSKRVLLSTVGFLRRTQLQARYSKEEMTPFLTEAAREEDREVRRQALRILSGYGSEGRWFPAWNVDAAIPLLRECAEDWVKEPGKKRWCVEALVELEVDGYERFIREFEAYVQDESNYGFMRLECAKHLLRWGRIDEASVVELEKIVAEQSRPKRMTHRNGKITVEYLDDRP